MIYTIVAVGVEFIEKSDIIVAGGKPMVQSGFVVEMGRQKTPCLLFSYYEYYFWVGLSDKI